MRDLACVDVTFCIRGLEELIDAFGCEVARLFHISVNLVYVRAFDLRPSIDVQQGDTGGPVSMSTQWEGTAVAFLQAVLEMRG
jgi:hypothetical protein